MTGGIGASSLHDVRPVLPVESGCMGELVAGVHGLVEGVPQLAGLVSTQYDAVIGDSHRDRRTAYVDCWLTGEFLDQEPGNSVTCDWW